jgi:mono/diheme cytochrome c family protein
MSANCMPEARGQRPEGIRSAVALASGLWPLAFPGIATKNMLRLTVLLATTGGLSGCEWFTDFKRQPHVVTWESWRADSLAVRGAPQGSIPLDGTAVPAWMVSYAPIMATIDSMAGIANPVPVTEASLDNGRKYFQINCAVCHGSNADGQTPNGRYGIIPIPLTGEITKARTDGYIFGMIRNGRNTMPSYNRIEERDRWDVVNYVRALQGLVTDVPFERGPLALPGVNGDMVPGPSTIGPNRAIPYRRAVAPVTDSASPPGGTR